MRTITIYALKHPKTGKVCYVGKTEQKPKDRVYRHIAAAKQGRTSNVNVWLRSLLKKGLRPELEILEITTEKRGPRAEQFWIEHFIMAGLRLKNMTKGGYGSIGYSHDEKAREKIKAARARQVFTAEHRAALSRAGMGNQRAAGPHLSARGPNPNKRWSEDRKKEFSEHMKRVREEKYWNSRGISRRVEN